MHASPRRSELLLLVFLAAVFAVSSTVVIGSMVHIERAGLTVGGIEDGAVLRAAAVYNNISVTAGDTRTLDRVEVLVDDEVVATRRTGNRLILAGFEPEEGDHKLLARVRNATPLLLDAKVEHEFTVTR
ncbi:hypothetical protein SAMN05216188_106265 [Lentzea xinjiangensis]|uniref:Uncharacterized protein n=1 Tax=Lentzea xinjiangensis TaxID=402600 RepID=A0A1H9K271_9PSEU|nr:hypothetical protein [Lentzea xinjiangensis]SEQ93306.1 hypothetical protein SAMN05216188_106265 [Lentzea xinjiangensis]